jgi:hypothetical protein
VRCILFTSTVASLQRREAGLSVEGDAAELEPVAHQWVGAAQVPLDERMAKYADRRGVVPTAALLSDDEYPIQVVEVYCHRCRTTFERGRLTTCAAGSGLNSIYLRGGPIGERKKRKGPHIPVPDARAVLPGTAVSGTLTPPDS